MTDPAPPHWLGFDWHLVRAYLATLEAGSVSAAAVRLQAQQSTLSRHLAELEAQLGAPLFERTGRGVAPTALGRAIAESARQMQAGAESLSQVAALRRSAAGGTVRISASQLMAVYVLPAALAPLAGVSGLQLEIVASNAVHNLLRREADIALRMVRPDQSSLIARRVGQVGVGAYAHDSYLQRAGTPLVPNDLAHHTLVGYASSDLIERGAAAAGHVLTRAQFALRTDDHITYGRLVAEGAGIGFLAHFNARQWGLRPVLPDLPIAPHPCWLVVHREIRSDKAIRQVFDHLAAVVPGLLQEAAPVQSPGMV